MNSYEEITINAEHEPENDANFKPKFIKTWGNQQTMNLNPLIHSNIVQSHYWKVDLKEVTSYHQIVDEIYNNVNHLEPWERGSKIKGTSTGGGVRGVGVKAIASTAFTLMYKLFTMKVTRKQLLSIIDHPDSPYIRGVGFLFIRYCINPEEHWTWFEKYLLDDTDIDCKAGGGEVMKIGQMLQIFLTKLDWYDTKFPRLPVLVQKNIEQHMSLWKQENQPSVLDNHKKNKETDHLHSKARCRDSIERRYKDTDRDYDRNRHNESKQKSSNKYNHQQRYKGRDRDFRDRSPVRENCVRDDYRSERHKSEHRYREDLQDGHPSSHRRKERDSGRRDDKYYSKFKYNY